MKRLYDNVVGRFTRDMGRPVDIKYTYRGT